MNEPFDENPGLNWAFVFAHPDDEIAVASWIRRLNQIGVATHMIWAHRTPVRERESRNAVMELGVPTDRLTFLDFPDGQMETCLTDLKLTLKSTFDSIQPDRVVCAAFEQGHLDHDSVNWACSRAFLGPKLEFPEYWPYTPRVHRVNEFSRPFQESSRTLSDEERDFKLLLASFYPSQHLSRKIKLYEARQKLTRDHPLIGSIERLRWMPNHDYFSPAHDEPLKTKLLGHRNWNIWIKALTAISESPL